MSDHTDPGGVGAAHGGERPGRARVGDSGSPVGSPLTIALSVIAVVVGFLIFRTIDSGGSAGAGPNVNPDPAATTQPAGGTAAQPGSTTAAAATTSTAPQAIDPDVRIIVVNVGRVPQSAGAMSDELADEGFTMVDAVTGAGDETVEETEVQFLTGSGPGVQATARIAADRLGGVTVTGVDAAPALIEGDTVGAATVFVLLGADLAGEELPLDAPATPTQPPIVGPTSTTEPAG